MSEPTDNSRELSRPGAVKEEMLKIYPPKTRKKRDKQILRQRPGCAAEIAANSRTIPGIITQRGCTYAGCRGVVIGPIYDIAAYHPWAGRLRVLLLDDPPEPGPARTAANQLHAILHDHRHAGGAHHLRRREEARGRPSAKPTTCSNPRRSRFYSTCPVGLIGDDIHTVARKMKEELGINVLAFSCEGYKGVSQSAGHHIANNGVFKHIVGLDDTPDQGQFNINILGEYNIGGDAWEIDALLGNAASRHGDLQRQRQLRPGHKLRTRPISTASCATARSTTWPK